MTKEELQDHIRKNVWEISEDALPLTRVSLGADFENSTYCGSTF